MSTKYMAFPNLLIRTCLLLVVLLPSLGLFAQDISFSVALQSGRACRRVARPFKRRPKIRALKNNWNVVPTPLIATTPSPTAKANDPIKTASVKPQPKGSVTFSPNAPNRQPTANYTPPLERLEPIKPRTAKQLEMMKQVELQMRTAQSYVINPIFFVTGQDEFAVVDMEPFMMAVEFALQGRMILIEGHTDDIGTEASNFALSLKRVEKIKRLMLDIGVPDERVSVIAYGETQPIADNSSLEGRQQNRRVEFKVF